MCGMLRDGNDRPHRCQRPRAVVQKDPRSHAGGERQHADTQAGASSSRVHQVGGTNRPMTGRGDSKGHPSPWSASSGDRNPVLLWLMEASSAISSVAVTGVEMTGPEAVATGRILNLAIAVDVRVSALECLFVRLTLAECQRQDPPMVRGEFRRRQEQQEVVHENNWGMARQCQSFGSVWETGSGPSELPPPHQQTRQFLIIFLHEKTFFPHFFPSPFPLTSPLTISPQFFPITQSLHHLL